jgi:fumarylacetoacetase
VSALEHLPYGVFSLPGEPARVGVALDEHVLDLAQLAATGLLDLDPALFAERLNPFMAAGPEVWQAARARVIELLTTEARGVEHAFHLRKDVELHLPFAVADYVDFYSSRAHAENLGRLFRPDEEPLTSNWLHLPIGYHGRAGTLVVSGTPIRRPRGQVKLPGADSPAFQPSARLDIELELGVVIGTPSLLREAVPVDRALEHVFGVVLVNDWSARDIQAWEYVPLGPFLGKSFATSIGAWVTPLEALAPYRVPGATQEPEPLPHLRVSEPTVYDVELEVTLNAEVISRTNARTLYWTVEQQIAHLTSNGAALRTGDLLASGTISGSEPDSRGSLIELTWNGAEPLQLEGGATRTFLEDGDEVVLRGRTSGFELAEVRGRIEPA